MKLNCENKVHEILARLQTDSDLPATAQKILEKTPIASSNLVADLLFCIIKELRYSYFKDLVHLVLAYEADLEKNANVMLQAAFAAWVQGFNDDCERWSKRVISMAPKHPSGYLRLGLNFLSNQKFVEAFIVLSAGLRNTNNNQELVGWFFLSERMAVGSRDVVFKKFGKTFHFQLSCFNGQAMESDAAHLSGGFTEESELEFLAGVLDGCKSFVEVGALVGNHTVFLASFLQPEKYLIVDALDLSIQETKKNVECNRCNYPRTVFNFVEAALGASGDDEVVIGGKKVMTRPLEELIPEDVDFLKIDIDGMEGSLLDPLIAFISDKNLKIFIEVESQYLEAYNKKMNAIGYLITNKTDHGSYSNLFLQKSMHLQS